MECRSRRRELVVVPRSLLAHVNESGPPQVRQVPRDRGLRQFQDLNEIAYAQFLGLNETQDSETDRVRKRPKHQIHVGFGRRRHIRLGGLHQSAPAAVNDAHVTRHLTRATASEYGCQ